jgi:hypothetical protein
MAAVMLEVQPQGAPESHTLTVGEDGERHAARVAYKNDYLVVIALRKGHPNGFNLALSPQELRDLGLGPIPRPEEN